MRWESELSSASRTPLSAWRVPQVILPLRMAHEKDCFSGDVVCSVKWAVPDASEGFRYASIPADGGASVAPGYRGNDGGRAACADRPVCVANAGRRCGTRRAAT